MQEDDRRAKPFTCSLEEMRKSAVKRIEQGESPEAVAQGICFNRRTIYRWLGAFVRT